MQYEAVIGLETHVQLKTKSKMWCGCANEFGAPPNSNVCPVCLGLPGVLPVANEEALRLTALTGFLLNCAISRYAKFDRKNYFYPDMPKNYQITQYDKPSTMNGYVEFEFNGGISRVRITRVHLEEDVGKNFHFERNSGVDFNRAGVPLMEIVSEPDLTSPAMAYEYLNALKDILVYGGVSDCDMEKGMVRCDVNVSVRPAGERELGAKIEINNLRAKLAESQTALADLRFQPGAILELITLVEGGAISTKIAQDVFAEMFATGQPPAKIVEKKGLAQVSDAGAIEKFCDQAVAANPGPAADYQAGKVAALNFLKGQVMKLSKGKANPALVGEILERKLKTRSVTNEA